MIVNHVLYNGHIRKQDKGLLPLGSDFIAYGYGLFETILYQRKRFFFYDEHLRRLGRSAAFFGMPNPIPVQSQSLVLALIQHAALEDERLKVKVHLMRHSAETSHWFVTLRVLESAAMKSIRLHTCRSITLSALRRHKTCNLMDVRHAQEALRDGDILIMDKEDYAVECGYANIGMIQNGILFLVEERSPILMGITQQKIASLAGHLFKDVTWHRGFLQEDLLKADEVLYMNALCHGTYVSALVSDSKERTLSYRGYAERIKAILDAS